MTADATSPPRAVLTVNSGSSSIKFARFDSGTPPLRSWRGSIERVGRSDCRLQSVGPKGAERSQQLHARDSADAAACFLDWLDAEPEFAELAGVGHRIVHGGPHRFDPQRVDATLLAELRQTAPLDPNHLPAELALIDTLARRRPALPQFVCFDTAFHRNLPAVAKTLPIPRQFADAGMHRYGFHGLSYQYLMEALERQAGAGLAHGRVVLAHLGSGASMAAVRDGRCLDTTMGFTPAGGLMMGTRSGDLDPGAVVHLARHYRLTAEQLDHVVCHRSGLLGVSETSGDWRDLLAREASDPRAAEATALFCYQARKQLGAFAAALGGLDALVFAGGIGEHSPEARARICAGLECLGVRLDPAANAGNAATISAPGAAAAVFVIPADEEAVIARAAFGLLAEQGLPSWTTKSFDCSTRTGVRPTTSPSGRFICSTIRCCGNPCGTSTSSRGCWAIGAPRRD